MNLRYIEYGKIFLNSSKGALEYSPLNRSDNEIIKNTKSFYLNEIATLGIESDSSNRMNEAISFALLPWDKVHFLFIQLQRRREDEFVDKSKYTPETQRPFNQARFTFINKKDVNPRSFRLSQSLFFESPEYPGRKRLLDYVHPCKVEVEKLLIEKKKVTTESIHNQNKELSAKIIDVLFIKSIPEKADEEDAERNVRSLKPIYIKSNTSLDKKIFLFDELQYLLYPALGPITFASDPITNREVNIVLADESPERIEKDHSFEGELPEFSDESYFKFVSILKEEELYSEVFEHYIRTELKPKESVTLFKLIETDQEFSEEEELRTINNYIKHIRGQDFSKIIQNRFNNYEKLLKLIPILKAAPLSKRLIICRKVHIKVDKKLEKYYLFHLAAISGFAKFSEELYEFRELLRDSAIHSSEKLLDQIPLEDKAPLYEEFILIDCKYNKTSSILEYIPSLHFAPDSVESNNNKHQTILHLLVEKHDDAFWSMLQALSETKIWNELLNQIIGILENKQWSIKEIHRLWKIEPQKNGSVFLRLLALILLNSNQNSELNNNPLIFQKFLEEGRELSFSSVKKSLADKRFHTASLLNYLTNTDNTKIASQLRNVCIQASIPSLNENVTFGSWWFLEELLTSEEEIFTNDYSEIIKKYQPKFLGKNIDLTNKSIYLLSGGRLGDGASSVVGSLPIKTNSPKTESGQFDIYFKILSFWANKQLVVSKSDIVFLIDQLPDNNARSILYQLALSNSKKQLNEIRDIPSNDAIKWLKKFRILSNSNEDLLLNMLLGINTPNVEFTRFILVFDLTLAKKFNSWKDFSAYKNQIFLEIQKKIPADIFTKNYLHLISLLDGPYDINKYQDILKFISLETSDITQLREAELNQTNINLHIILDFISENQRIDDSIKQGINSILSKIYSISKYQEIIKSLNANYLKVLRLYAIDQKGKIKPELQEIVENEYVKRLNAINISMSLSSTQPRKTLKEPEKKKELVETGLTNNQAQISTLEWMLYVILALVILIILFLSIVGLSDAVFKELWHFFKFIRN
jgi:hypothetical protein